MPVDRIGLPPTGSCAPSSLFTVFEQGLAHLRPLVGGNKGPSFNGVACTFAQHLGTRLEWLRRHVTVQRRKVAVLNLVLHFLSNFLSHFFPSLVTSLVPSFILVFGLVFQFVCWFFPKFFGCLFRGLLGRLVAGFIGGFFGWNNPEPGFEV